MPALPVSGLLAQSLHIIRLLAAPPLNPTEFPAASSSIQYTPGVNTACSFLNSFPPGYNPGKYKLQWFEGEFWPTQPCPVPQLLPILPKTGPAARAGFGG